MVGGPGLRRQPVQHRDLARRPPAGSTWKVITLAAALRQRLLARRHRRRLDPCRGAQDLPEQGSTVNAETARWRPHATSGTPPSGSVNCAFVRLATSVGQDKVIDMAHDDGDRAGTTCSRTSPSPSGWSSRPPRLATVMATIANDGVHHTPYVVQKVMSPDGKVVFDAERSRVRWRSARRRRLRGRTSCAASSPGAPVATPTSTATPCSARPAPPTARPTPGSSVPPPQLATAVWFGNRTGNAVGWSAGLRRRLRGAVFRRS